MGAAVVGSKGRLFLGIIGERLRSVQSSGQWCCSSFDRQSGSLYERTVRTIIGCDSILDYCLLFIKMAAPLEKVPERYLLGQILNGLKEEIRVEVGLMDRIN